MMEIFRKETASFFSTATAYIIITVFLTATWLFVWVFPETSVLNYGFADLDVFFSLTPYVFIFLIPAVMMRTFAEEKKAGTLELLLTKPVKITALVSGKYLAGPVLVFFLLLPTVIFYFSVSRLGDPAGNIDTPAVIGAYIGLFFLGSCFSALGIFASALTSNQVTAFVVGVFSCFIFYEGFSSLSSLISNSSYALFIEELGLKYRYRSLGKGLIDSRSIIYLLSVISLSLWGTAVFLKKNLK